MLDGFNKSDATRRCSFFFFYEAGSSDMTYTSATALAGEEADAPQRPRIRVFDARNTPLRMA
jgi:hypothetical protein